MRIRFESNDVVSMEESQTVDPSNRLIDFPDDLADEEEQQLKQNGRWTTPSPLQISGTKGLANEREKEVTRRPMNRGKEGNRIFG